MYFLQTISTKCFVILTILVFCSSKSELENRSFKIDTDKTSSQASIEISQGKEHIEFIRPPLAKTTELSKPTIETHLERLEPMPENETEQEFAIREKSKPAPRTGVTVESEFPSALDLAPTATHLIDDNVPLTVLRFAPQGSVELAPHVSITFSRPMVKITSQVDAVKNIPVTLEPQPKGAWRWMGTRTLIFEPERETLPRATHYKVTIDHKATSTDGKRINGEKTFSFSTPPVKIKTHFPISSGAANPANVPIFIEFNQRIDQQSIAEMIQVRVGRSRKSFRIGNPDELSESFSSVKKMVENAGENKWILIFMDEVLPPSEHITVTLKKGARSLEGPVQTSADQSFRFRSFYPLTIKNQSCDDKELPCTPEQVWSFAANNFLDTSNFDPSMVKITPEVEGLDVFVRGTSVLVNGYKTPQTKFVVELSREIRDRFGQNLSGPNKFTLFVGNAFPDFLSYYSQMSIVDPFASPSVRVNTVNYQTLAVEVWRVNPEHWSTYSNIRQNRWYRNKHNFLKQIPGQKVASTTVKIDGELNRLTETQIDLSKYLPQGKGHLIVCVSPASYMKSAEKSVQRDEYPRLITWLQATNIGLDAWTDPKRLLVMATSLDKGKPLSDIKITAGSKQGTTRKDGSATFDLPNSSSSVLLATQGKDSAFLPMSLAGKLRSDQALFHVFDDRSMYRPGENVHVKGWVRKISQQVGADIEYPDANSRLTYNVLDSRYNEIAKGSASLSSLGGFDFSFDIPSSPNLGHSYIRLRVEEFSHTHTFQIQEFRTPEFEVNTNAGIGPHFAGEEFVSTVSGTYYAGGGLSGAPVNWYLCTSKASFTHPTGRNSLLASSYPGSGVGIICQINHMQMHMKPLQEPQTSQETIQFLLRLRVETLPVRCL